MADQSYDLRRGELEAYFDRTAAVAWSRLTSDAPVGRIRATVRAGRNEMRQTLLSWLPTELEGQRLLDAGCGTGALAVEAARRGACVVAVDLSATLIGLAQQRAPRDFGRGRLDFRVGDMLDPALERFDYVVAMDALIHYRAHDTVRMLSGLADRTDRSLLFSFAPRTVALTLMHAVGRFFPQRDRAPSIEPIGEAAIWRRLAAEPGLSAWRQGRTRRIVRGFYISQALELLPA
jgi:magnesium-protoporphyrin O-methyltransferase